MKTHSIASLRLTLRFALDGLSSQRGRSALTMLGMAVGTASVVIVISIGLVGRDYVVGLIEGIRRICTRDISTGCDDLVEKQRAARQCVQLGGADELRRLYDFFAYRHSLKTRPSNSRNVPK